MRAAALCLLLSCSVSGSALASTGSALASAWSDLWATPEQQAQHLLDRRQPAAAAPLFKDPRRRGYAELRARQYAQAAKSLAPLRDADSLYNRGNALAHTGQLRDALGAYDAALKQSPGNADIVHNRDLVASALEKQQHPQQSAKNPQGSGSGKQQGGGGGQGGSTGQHGQPGNQRASSDPGASGRKASSGGQPPGHEQGERQAQANSQAGQSSGSPGQSAGTAQSANPAQPPGTSQSGNAAQPAGTTQGGAQTGTGSEPGEAFADARGASKSTAPSDGKSATPNAELRDAHAAGEAQPPPPPRSEQSLALDQWLRGIPDDSGELLRRKFLIEHMINQRQVNPP